MKNTFVNLSTHPVAFCDADGKEILTIPASGNTASLIEETVDLPAIDVVQDGQTYSVPLVTKKFKGVELPDPKPGVIYLTSNLIAEKANRDDVLAPHEKIRDKDGNVIGRVSLVKFRA